VQKEGSWMTMLLIAGIAYVLFKEVFQQIPAMRRYIKLERM
jgi:hypothetical protein